ncbi:MAG TPA: hypothetical protein PK400_11865, partial [Phycisphaerales bacterium]|nr:hypothetical protein [Phycisphaerales bacterium]
RAASFPLRNNVRVYGGFAGIESDLSERNWVINKTTLSGDLNEDDDFNASYNQNGQLILSFTNYSTDNSHHVVSAIGAQEPINRTAHLDGFVIEGGTGFAGTCSALGGGGLLVDHGTPTIRNCEFRRNRSHPNAEAGFGNANGGAVFISSAGPLEEQVLFENCVFIHNEGLKGGGAVYAAPYAPVVFIRCQFIENLCGEKTGGGALWTITDCDLVNCTIVKNQVTGLASPGGAAIYSQGGVVRIWNCLVAENHAFAEDSAGAFYFSNGNIEIISSTLANNIAENGVGGIEMAGGQLTVD